MSDRLVVFFFIDLCFDDVSLDPMELREHRDELVQSMSLLQVKLPTYEEALNLANECLSGSSESTSITSPDGSHASKSQCDPYSPSPSGKLSHSPFPSPVSSQMSHSSAYISPNTIPTPDPSPLGHPEQERISVNISWQPMGQKVSPQPQLAMQQRQRLPFPPMHMPQPNMGGRNVGPHLSKSALTASMIKKQERGDYGSCSSTTGMLPRQGWAPPNQQIMTQPCDYKNMPLNHGTIPIGPESMVTMSPDNPVYATNVNGAKWDTMAVPPLFEDTLPSLDYNGTESMDTMNRQNMPQNMPQSMSQNMSQNMFEWDQRQDLLSPPYQDEFVTGFGFQVNPVPVTKDGW